MKINIDQLINAIEKSWSKETCYPYQQIEWTEDNPALGQCAVTSLVVQDYLGGEIGYDSNLKHYWNILIDNSILDLTIKQFPSNTIKRLEKFVSRDYLLTSERAKAANTLKRYSILKNKVSKLLNEKI